MNAIFQLLNPNNTVTVNRPLAHAIGLNETVIYGALISKYHYYSEHGMIDSGWFYSTVTDLEESTALTERQQKRAIDKLVAAGLIRFELRGMPAKRSFYIVDDIAILEKYIAVGEKRINELKPQNAEKMKNKMQHRELKKAENSSREPVPQPCSDKMSEQSTAKSQSLFRQNVDTCSDKTLEQHFIKSKYNKSKDNNHIYQSMTITTQEEKTKVITEKNAVNERKKYLEIIHNNIGYDPQYYEQTNEKEKADELVEIMLDVICSNKEYIRANGENVPKEVVKRRFLELNYEHIDYVLLAMQKNTSYVRNIRAYLTTALYNAPTTIHSYYSALVNHDMYGRKRVSA